MNVFIKNLMTTLEISQKELADLLGISPSAVNQWENTKNIKPEYLYSLSKIFNVTVDELLEEKFKEESPEERQEYLWNTYNLDGSLDHNFDDLTIEYATEFPEIGIPMLEDYAHRLINTNKEFYPLIYKKIMGTLTDKEREILNYIRKYFEVKPECSPATAGDTELSVEDEDIDIKIGKKLIDTFGANDRNSVIWELQKIYRCTRLITMDKWYDNSHFNNVLEMYDKARTQLQRDKFLVNHTKRLPDINLFTAGKYISSGKNLLYDEIRLPDARYTMEELELFEGEKKPIKYMDEAREVFEKIGKKTDNVDQLYYADYKKLIDRHTMKMLKAYNKYGEKDIFAFWQYLRNEQY